MSNLREAMISNEKLSLRKISQISEVSYATLLKAARQPIPGEVWDPNSVNYDALTAKVDAKMSADFDWTSVEEVDPNQLAAKQLPQLDTSMKCTLKSPGYNSKWSSDTIFQIVYVTETHVVLQPEDSTEPRLLSKSTFLLCRPDFIY